MGGPAHDGWAPHPQQSQSKCALSLHTAISYGVIFSIEVSFLVKVSMPWQNTISKENGKGRAYFSSRFEDMVHAGRRSVQQEVEKMVKLHPQQ